jgi:hypothetical protein
MKLAPPPAVAVAIVTPGVEPPVSDAVAVICATSTAPPKVIVYGPPLEPVT